MTREELFEKMKDLPNPPCRVNLIQQVWEIMNSETEELKKENVELRKKNEELDVFLDAGTMINKGLNSMNKALTEERNNYRNMVFDQKDNLNKAKDIISKLIDDYIKIGFARVDANIIEEAEQFLKEIDK